MGGKLGDNIKELPIHIDEETVKTTGEEFQQLSMR